MGLTDDVPPKYTVTIRGIYTTVEKGQITLLDGHSPHPWSAFFFLETYRRGHAVDECDDEDEDTRWILALPLQHPPPTLPTPLLEPPPILPS